MDADPWLLVKIMPYYSSVFHLEIYSSLQSLYSHRNSLPNQRN
uniref:Uncharacterized protein n=1 Tax=Arundo donax TaxID=35708 RepID=A0A0A9G666_ARUDO